MKEIYIKIEGITCDSCRKKITKRLKEVKNIKKVTFDGHVAKVEYSGILSKERLIELIVAEGYHTDNSKIVEKREELTKIMTLKELFKIIIIILLLVLILNSLFGFNVFNVIPAVNSKTSYTMLFFIGLMTSIHCVFMCGSINLLASYSGNRSLKRPILYNLGRLVSYTTIGGIVGFLGNVLTINVYVQGVIIIISSLLMLIMAFNMMGLTNFTFRFKGFKKMPGKRMPFVIGLLNGFVPCGPLQAMQVYALATGSALSGALSMFLFCLGTVPLMLFLGLFSNYLNGSKKKILNKISVALIIMLSFAMLNRGLLSMGLDLGNVFKVDYSNYNISEIKEDYQYIEINLTYDGYDDIVVQKDIPVKMKIIATKDTLTGCNNAVIINKYNIKQGLEIGDNIIEFTPKETGVFTYTCWMGMLKNNIVVVDDLSTIDK